MLPRRSYAIGMNSAKKLERPALIDQNRRSRQSSDSTLSKNEYRRLSASAYHCPGPLLAAKVAAHNASVQSRRCIERSNPLPKNNSDHSHQVPSFFTPHNKS